MIATHWDPYEDYCVYCGKFIDAIQLSRSIPTKCTCDLHLEAHNVYRSIHQKCLQEVEVIATKVGVNPMITLAGLEMKIPTPTFTLI